MNPVPCETPAASAEVLRHAVTEGPVASVFLREGAMAAQLLLTSGLTPRWVVAFAAGNSGAAVWFHADDGPVGWRRVGDPVAIEQTDARGRCLRGIEVVVEADCTRLRIRQTLLGSLRVIRDHQFDARLPALGGVEAQLTPTALHWARDRLDGAAGYALSVQVEDGHVEKVDGGGLALVAALHAGPLRLRVRALTGDEPLTPLAAAEVLTADAADLPSARVSLLFLSYREKLLAGSWRFHTYFGRDTLMTLRLLLPVLQPTVIEAALGSVLSRLSALGEVAHEEDIGEFALLTRVLRGEAASAQPIFDYKMVDDDFMLLPVICAYLLGTPAGRRRAPAFLAHAEPGASRHGALLARNVAWVLQQAQAFAGDPVAANLVRLKPGEIVGDWRDSADGLGGGVYSYSTNAVLVAAALRAAEALNASGLLAPHLGSQVEACGAEAGAWAAVWEQCAPALFEVRRSPPQATEAVRLYADELGLPAAAALASLAGDGGVFAALALDAQGRALPLLHSDFSFALLLSTPPQSVLQREVGNMMRPFPAGLITPVGLLVANAVHADAAVRPLFGADRYHGAVVWSWQQAMLAAGLERQLQRPDLDGATRAQLSNAQATVWRLIAHTQAIADGELWSWVNRGGEFALQSFGPISASADESNAAQLWSTVYLGVKPPATAAGADDVT